MIYTLLLIFVSQNGQISIENNVGQYETMKECIDAGYELAENNKRIEEFKCLIKRK